MQAFLKNSFDYSWKLQKKFRSLYSCIFCSFTWCFVKRYWTVIQFENIQVSQLLLKAFGVKRNPYSSSETVPFLGRAGTSASREKSTSTSIRGFSVPPSPRWVHLHSMKKLQETNKGRYLLGELVLEVEQYILPWPIPSWKFRLADTSQFIIYVGKDDISPHLP
jgi:hypothetical protein